jgi:TatD DNase family protein
VIDFHCHLDLYSDPAAVRDECARRGIEVLSVTTTPSAWDGTLALGRESPHIRTALGFHPQLAHERHGELELFDRLITQAHCVGEIGLDGHPDFRRHWKYQTQVFEHVLSKCSSAGGRLMSVHSRRASSAVLDRLQEFSRAGTPVLHWFSGSAKDLDRAIDLGCWFSVGPAMLAGENGRMLAARMPRDRVLTESDGPFVQVDGQPIMPWNIDRAIKALAHIWSLPGTAATDAVRFNFQRLFSNESAVRA